jgi:plastocyanin
MRRWICTLAFMAFGALAVPAVAADAVVTFQCCSYSPRDVRILPGEKVTITAAAGNDFSAATGSSHHPLHFVDGIGDQTSGTVAERSFAGPGTYLWYCGNHGSTNGTTVSGMSGKVTVTANQPPVPSFTASATSVPSGTQVSFDASGSTDPNSGQTLTYAWDLDGNGTDDPGVTGATPSFTYVNSGTTPRTITVRLRATDDNSDAVGPESSTTTKTITVAPAGASTPPPGGAGSTPPPSAGSGITSDTTAPTVALKLAKTLTVGAKLGLSFTSDEPGSATATLRFGKQVLKGRTNFAAAGKHTVTVKLSKAARRALRQRREVRVKLVVADAAGNMRTLTRTLKLKTR